MRLTISCLTAGLLVCFPITSLAVAAPLEDRSAAAEGGLGLCWFNLAGLGSCIDFDETCFEASPCDASTPCADGELCVRGTSCFSPLFGVCLLASGVDAACSNPKTLETGPEVCESILFHEDFAPPPQNGPDPPPTSSLHQMVASQVCGTGSSQLANDTCPSATFASSPLDVARYGIDGICGFYGDARNRVSATTPPIDISGCAGAQLDFDYRIAFQESAEWDRAFVTVTVDDGVPRVIATNQIGAAQAFTKSGMSCAGTVLPVGTLIQDNFWHHYRAGIGSGSSVRVEFWGEVYDEQNNSGEGFLYDDVRVDCGDLVFADGFEGANLLRWSSNTAPLPSYEIWAEGATCATYRTCAGPGVGCFALLTAENTMFCMNLTECTGACSSSAECPEGQMCILDDCCTAGSSCAPVTCDPEVPAPV